MLAAVQRPISLNCITDPVGRPLWRDIPSWFLLAKDDRMIVPDTQHYMAERMKAKTKAHAVDHTPSVTLQELSSTLSATQSGKTMLRHSLRR